MDRFFGSNPFLWCWCKLTWFQRFLLLLMSQLDYCIDNQLRDRSRDGRRTINRSVTWGCMHVLHHSICVQKFHNVLCVLFLPILIQSNTATLNYCWCYCLILELLWDIWEVCEYSGINITYCGEGIWTLVQRVYSYTHWGTLAYNSCRILFELLHEWGIQPND